MSQNLFPRYLTFLVILFFGLFTPLSAQPAGFSDQLFLGNWNQVVGLDFDANGRMYVWEKGGKVWLVENGVKLNNPLLDISDEVGNWRDFGMLGFALDPNFLVNGYYYVFYVVDREHLINFGTPAYDPNDNDYFEATIGRITRYQADINTNFTTTIGGSRQILLGETITTGPAILHESHGTGHLVFGEDGTLLASMGDGASYSSRDEGSASETYYAQALADGIITPQENVGAYRCQMLNSLSGKVLRIDPATGDGVSSNPFYNASAPRSAESRVWSFGHRNHYRFSKVPNTGSHAVGDGNPGVFIYGEVGWGAREELGVIHTSGLNFGWPRFEGMTQGNGYSNPAYWENNNAVHELPKLDWRNSTPRGYINGNIVNVGSGQLPGNAFTGNSGTGGTWYNGDDFPAEWKDSYFFADYGGKWIRNVRFDANWNPVEVKDFLSNIGSVVFVQTHPSQGEIYYVRYPNEIHRVSYTGSGNQPPVAKASSNVNSGPSPLTVNFSSAGSFDPELGSLNYFWTFGDGATSNAPNPSHTYTATGNTNYTATLQVTDNAAQTDEATVLISLNNTPPQILSTSIDNTDSFSHTNGVTLTLNANATDNETPGNLSYAWQTFLFHNDHNHPEVIDNNASTSTQLSPIGCDGATYWYRVTLTVTDPAGLSAYFEKDIYPDCPGNNQTINFNALADKETDDPAFALNATASSGLPVIYFIASGPATLSGNMLNLSGVPGTVTVVATQPGNTTFAPAQAVFQSFNILPPGSLQNQTIDFPAIADRMTTDPPFDISATASSGLPVSFTIVSGPATISGNTITLTGNAGTVLVEANQGGNAQYNPASAVQQSFEVFSDEPIDQSIAFPAIADRLTTDGPFSISATASSGLPVSFEILSGPASIAGNIITLTGNEGTVIVEATQAGNDFYNAAPAVQQSFEVTAPEPLDQTIDFPAIANHANTDAPFDISATASSGLPVSFTIISGPATVSGNTITLTGTIGIVTVEATQAGNAEYNPAPAVQQSFEVIESTGSETNLNLSVSTNPPNLILWNSLLISFTVENTSSVTATDIIVDIPIPKTQGLVQGGESVLPPGHTLDYLNDELSRWNIPQLGPNESTTFVLDIFVIEDNPVDYYTQIIQANPTDINSTPNNNPGPSPIEDDEAFLLLTAPGAGPQDQSINFPAIADKEADEAPFVISATATSGLPVSFAILSGPATIDGNTISLSGDLGIVTIEATQAGNTAYNPAPAVQQSFEVVEPTLDDQSIDFPALANVDSDAAPFAISATASSGLPVSFAILSGPATIDGNTITLTGNVGTVTVEATQAGDAQYNPAVPVQQSFEVLEPGLENQSIAFPPIDDYLTTDAPFVISASASSGLPIAFAILSGPATIDGNTITLTGNEGTVTVEASQAGNAQYNPATPVQQSFEVYESTGNETNLSLSLSANPPDILIWNAMTITYMLTNSSSVAATGITVDVPIPKNEGLVLGTSPTMPSGQSFDYVNDVLSRWNVDQLGPNESTSFDLDLYAINDQNTINYYTQIIAASPVDINSTPDNNPGPNPTEDDEAVLILTAPGVGPQNQSITFVPVPDKVTSDPPFNVSAIATSGLPVTAQIESGPATIDGNAVYLTGEVGSVIIRYSQDGDANYNPAPDVFDMFDVELAGPPTVVIDSPSEGESIIGETVDLNYTLSGDLTEIYHLFLTLDDNPMIDVHNLNGEYTFENVPLGAHTITAQLADEDHIPLSHPEATFVVNFNTIPDPGPSDPPTGYCTAQGNEPWWQWISNVQFGDIDHSSGKDLYGDFTNHSTIVVKGNAYPISLTPDFSWLSYDEHWRVWIDYNRDGDFDDAGELVFEDHGTAAVNGTITIPFSASNGATRMRVAMQENTYADPCGSFQYGEVEDYLVQITGASSLEDSNINTGQLNFVAYTESDYIQLHWITNRVDVPHHFILEQSDDGVYFNTILEVESKAISETAIAYYSRIEKPGWGAFFYRIQMVFEDGTKRISNSKRLEFKPDERDISIFPNPTQEDLFADLAKFSGISGTITITNVLGAVVYQERIDQIPSSLVQFKLGHLIRGNYVISFDFEGQVRINKQFIIK